MTKGLFRKSTVLPTHCDVTTPTQQPLTYADIAARPDDELWELIDGIPYLMATPQIDHQTISVKFTRYLDEFFEDKPCRVFHAPIGVFLPKKNETLDETRNFVIPDLIVVCDEKKLESRGCRGAPDLVIEIVSPSSGSRDHLQKLNLYEKHGVKEYWIIAPDTATVSVFQLEPGKKRYGRPDFYDKTMKIGSRQFPGLAVNLARVFQTRSVKEPAPPTFSFSRKAGPRKAKPGKKATVPRR